VLPEVWGTLADLVTHASSFPNLTDSTALAMVLTSLLRGTTPALTPAVVDGAAGILANVFQLIETISLPPTNRADDAGTPFLNAVAQNEQVAEKQVAPS
jgi:hypothetical protein